LNNNINLSLIKLISYDIYYNYLILFDGKIFPKL